MVQRGRAGPQSRRGVYIGLNSLCGPTSKTVNRLVWADDVLGSFGGIWCWNVKNVRKTTFSEDQEKKQWLKQTVWFIYHTQVIWYVDGLIVGLCSLFRHETTQSASQDIKNKKDDIKKQNIRAGLEIRKSAEVEDEQKNYLMHFVLMWLLLYEYDAEDNHWLHHRLQLRQCDNVINSL